MERNTISATNESVLSEQIQREANEFAKLLLDIYRAEKRNEVKVGKEME